MAEFNNCEICGNGDWKVIYQGNIRDGSIGRFRKNVIIAECSSCLVQRLNEENSLPLEKYQDTTYAQSVAGIRSVMDARRGQHHLYEFMALALGAGLERLRNKTVVDVGCGAGVWFDFCGEIAGEVIGVEPNRVFRQFLQNEGRTIYNDLESAIEERGGEVDWVISSQVIEHVESPKCFLNEIRQLLKPGGEAMISTPNRNDILMASVPGFEKFFFRTQHRWYFDKESLENCVQHAGFDIVELKFIHRYGVSNFLSWLEKGRPDGVLIP
jgi:2-polyprenyl-3-methyl-5-hydroxy-6-metoxy-1,4-benzoquinol methylase